jgi:hypothetical protein
MVQELLMLVEPMFSICHVGCHKGWKLGHLGPNLYNIYKDLKSKLNLAMIVFSKVRPKE